MNANWFNAMIRFHNTVRFIQGTWCVSNAIARHIQTAAACGATQSQCHAIAAAHRELTSQVGA